MEKQRKGKWSIMSEGRWWQVKPGGGVGPHCRGEAFEHYVKRNGRHRRV